MNEHNLQPAKAKKVKKMHPEIHNSEKSSKGGGETEREVIVMDLSSEDETCANSSDGGPGINRPPAMELLEQLSKASKTMT
jgi:hypothetical protein